MYISREFLNVWGVILLCNTWLRLLNLLYDIEVMWQKTIKHAFSMFYTLIKHGFLINPSMCRVLSIFINDTKKVKTSKNDNIHTGIVA